MSAAIRFYIDLTPDSRHCPPGLQLGDTRIIILCDDCAASIRDDLSMDYAREDAHARNQHLLCSKCMRNGFGEPATRTDLKAADIVCEEPRADLESDLIRAHMERSRKYDEAFAALFVPAPTMLEELRANIESDLAEAWSEAKRFEAQWELALHEIAGLKAERDALRNRWQSTDVLDAIDGVMDLAYDQQAEIELVWAGRREQWRKGIAADIATVQRVLDEQRALANPDPASPAPASVATAPITVTGVVDEEHFWARPMSDVAYLAARKLYDAGDIAGAQRVILEDLIAQNRDKSLEWGKASPIETGDALEADPTTETGAAAGDGADA